MISFKDWVRTVSLISTVLFLFFTPQAAAISLTATDDAYTSSKSHKSKYANDGDLYIEDWSRNRRAYEDDDDEYDLQHRNNRSEHKQSKSGYVKFDTSVLDDDISGDDVRKASLRIFINQVKRPGMVHVYSVLGPWNENSLKHRQAPPNELTPLGSIMVHRVDEEHFRYIDITEVVKEWIANPATNDGLVLMAEGARIRIDSKENALTSHAMEVELSLASLGEQGIQGEPGIQGIQGIQGLSGVDGEMGEQGIQGIPGSQGIPGIPGTGGDKGEQGIKGDTGPGGLQGIQGLSGIQGETGDQGAQGDPGRQGPPGSKVRNIITVALEGGDFTSIQAAIDSIPQGVEITPTLINIAPGEYFEQLDLRSNIHLQGAGRGQTIIGATFNLINSCVFRGHLLCLEEVANVEISQLTISGLRENGDNIGEVAIAINRSSDINIHDTGLRDAFFGIRGELVGNIVVRNNHISGSGDGAIDISMTNSPIVKIVSNHAEQGDVDITGGGNLQIMGNFILGSSINEWQGKLQVTGNQIIGRVEFNGRDYSLFSNNIVFGSLVLIDTLFGSDTTVVVGNSITASGNVPAIEDNGKSTIMGNRLNSQSQPIDIPPGSESTIFANTYEGASDFPGHNSLISQHLIVLESKDENVTIKAGGSTIMVDSAGDITIDSVRDITLTAGGQFSVNATNISLNSSSTTTLEAGTGLNLKAGINTTIDSGNATTVEAGTGLNLKAGANTTIDSGVTTDINAGASVDIDAATIQLN